MKKLVLIALFGAFMNGASAQVVELISQTDIGQNWYSGHTETGGQSFTLTQATNLTEFRFYVLPAANEGITEISLREGEDINGEVLYTTTMNITTNGWITVTLPSVALCPGIYCFTISEFQWGAANLSNPYSGGRAFYVNGWENTMDMAFVISGEVVENTVPVPDVEELEDVISGCFITELTAPTATDDCPADMTITHDAVFPIVDGLTIITWTYNDGHGGVTTQTQNVIVEADVTGPTPDAETLEDITSACLVTTLEAPTATDCRSEVSVTNDATLPIGTTGTTVVTWTYTDAAGNTTTQTQNVILEADVTAPEPDAETLADITALCRVDIADVEAPTASDCRDEVTVTNNITQPIETTGTTVITWTYTDAAGNTTTQTQHVIIAGLNLETITSGEVLSADNADADYQWVDCNDGYALVTNATEQSFTIPGISGNYAVIITENGCMDTSACIAVDLTGLSTITAENVLIYPNPTNGILHIQAADLNPSHLAVIDLQGRMVFQQAALDFPLEINTANWENGMYVLQLNRDGQLIGAQRIIKE